MSIRFRGTPFRCVLHLFALAEFELFVQLLGICQIPLCGRAGRLNGLVNDQRNVTVGRVLLLQFFQLQKVLDGTQMVLLQCLHILIERRFPDPGKLVQSIVHLAGCEAYRPQQVIHIIDFIPTGIPALQLQEHWPGIFVAFQLVGAQCIIVMRIGRIGRFGIHARHGIEFFHRRGVFTLFVICQGRPVPALRLGISLPVSRLVQTDMNCQNQKKDNSHQDFGVKIVLISGLQKSAQNGKKRAISQPEHCPLLITI